MTQQSPFEDIDPIETQEWLESIDSVMRARGPERAHFLLEKLVDFTRRSGAYLPFEFEGHPLRKDFPLLAREVKPWPGLVDVEPMPGGDDDDADAAAVEAS